MPEEATGEGNPLLGSLPRHRFAVLVARLVARQIAYDPLEAHERQTGVARMSPDWCRHFLAVDSNGNLLLHIVSTLIHRYGREHDHRRARARKRNPDGMAVSPT